MLFLGSGGQVFPKPSRLRSLQIIHDPNPHPFFVSGDRLRIDIHLRLLIAVDPHPLGKDRRHVPQQDNDQYEEGSRQECYDDKTFMAVSDRLTSWSNNR